MELLFDGNNSLNDIFYDTLARAADLCALREGLDPDDWEVSLSVVSEEEIRSLNRQFRGIDRETDVLSFPQYDFSVPGDEEDACEEPEKDLPVHEDDPAGPETGFESPGDFSEGLRASLGDVVICEEAARRQAEEYGHSFEREFVYLFVHSMMHLLGYDHMEEKEKAEMREAEEDVMNRLGISREMSAPDPDSGISAAPADYGNLMRMAMEISVRAYAPYSRFSVGAALLASSGKIYTGVNVENASYGATICAERSAVSAAVTAGEKSFSAIAVYSPSGIANPCGICRQVLSEFGGDPVIITGSSEEEFDAAPLSSFLPKGFIL